LTKSGGARRGVRIAPVGCGSDAESVVVRGATAADGAAFRALAREVETLFGAPMGDDPAWIAGLERTIDRGTAWCAVDATDGAVLGGMTIGRPARARVRLTWLAVRTAARRHGAGRALVEHAIVQADGLPLHVITFGAGHPGGGEAEAARALYRTLGFAVVATDAAAPDGTPREELVWADVIRRGGGIELRPLRSTDAAAHLAGEDEEQLRGFEFPHGATLARVRDAIAEWRRSWATRGAVRNFGVWSAATGALAGNVEVRALDAETVNLSYLVFPEWRRRGVATRAAGLALGYARDEMGVRRAQIEALDGNVASLGVIRRLGARPTGDARRPSGSRHLTFELDLATLGADERDG
jgi:RimJ/RimL family protein N-acetyltransferase/ribosomal protein S18 acetylase RimI-like enzyme